MPLIATESDKGKPNVYEYWNFTHNKPQFYKCPNQFKYLYFRTGHHKEGLCLPCCTNIDPLDQKKKRDRYNQCMNQRKQLVETNIYEYAFKNTNKYQIDRLTLVKPLIK